MVLPGVAGRQSTDFLTAASGPVASFDPPPGLVHGPAAIVERKALRCYHGRRCRHLWAGYCRYKYTQAEIQHVGRLPEAPVSTYARESFRQGTTDDTAEGGMSDHREQLEVKMGMLTKLLLGTSTKIDTLQTTTEQAQVWQTTMEERLRTIKVHTAEIAIVSQKLAYIESGPCPLTVTPWRIPWNITLPLLAVAFFCGSVITRCGGPFLTGSHTVKGSPPLGGVTGNSSADPSHAEQNGTKSFGDSYGVENNNAPSTVDASALPQPAGYAEEPTSANDVHHGNADANSIPLIAWRGGHGVNGTASPKRELQAMGKHTWMPPIGDTATAISSSSSHSGTKAGSESKVTIHAGTKVGSESGGAIPAATTAGSESNVTTPDATTAGSESGGAIPAATKAGSESSVTMPAMTKTGSENRVTIPAATAAGTERLHDLQAIRKQATRDGIKPVKIRDEHAQLEAMEVLDIYGSTSSRNYLKALRAMPMSTLRRADVSVLDEICYYSASNLNIETTDPVTKSTATALRDKYMAIFLS